MKKQKRNRMDQQIENFYFDTEEERRLGRRRLVVVGASKIL